MFKMNQSIAKGKRFHWRDRHWPYNVGSFGILCRIAGRTEWPLTIVWNGSLSCASGWISESLGPRCIDFPIPNAAISTIMAKCDHKSDQISRPNLFFHNLMLSWTIWKFEFEQSCIWGMMEDQFISGIYPVSIWKRLLSKSYVKKVIYQPIYMQYTCKTPQNYAKLEIWGESELKYRTKNRNNDSIEIQMHSKFWRFLKVNFQADLFLIRFFEEINTYDIVRLIHTNK